MQLKIKMKADKPIAVPFNYNYQVQSAIYSKLREVGGSDFIHNEGFGEGKRYKSFVFGKLSGSHRVKNKQLIFTDAVSFEVRSTQYDICDSLQRSIEINDTIRLFDNDFKVISCTLENKHITGNKAVFVSDSPVVVHTTLDNGNTLYFSPDDAEFLERLKKNFYEKYRAINNRDAGEINVYATGDYKKIVTSYKGLWITGYMGRFIIEGESEYLEFIYNAGLGEKNSQGFGLMKTEENKMVLDNL